MRIPNSILYKRGGVIALLGFLHFGIYLLVRSSGDIAHVENRGSFEGRTIKAPSPEWIEIQEGLAEGSDSAMLASSVKLEKAKPWILNSLFWPLRKLETIFRDLSYSNARKVC